MSELSIANFLRYAIFPMESFVAFSAFYDFKSATILAMPLLFILAPILFIQQRLLREKSFRFINYKQSLIKELNGSQMPLLLSLALLLFILVVLPLLGLLSHTDTESFLHTSTLALPALSRSLLFAFFGAILLVLFGFASAYVINYRAIKGWHLLELELLLFFVISSVVLGIAFILFYNRVELNFIYSSPLIILLGYLVKYLFLSEKIIESALVNIPHNLLEAAKLTGASWRQIILYILLPLSKKSLIVTFFIGFIFAMRESTITALVAPAGEATLPLYIATQMANAHETTIASLSLLMIISVLTPLVLLLLYLRSTED